MTATQTKTLWIDATVRGISPLLISAMPPDFCDDGEKSRGIKTGAEATRREQAEGKLYLSSNGLAKKGKPVPVVPAQNLYKAIVEAGRFHKVGRRQLTTRDTSLVPAGLMILELEMPIRFSKPWEVDSRPITNQTTKGKSPCHRPRFDEWELDFTLEVETDEISEAMARKLVDDAGKKLGICSMRPECKGTYGKFVVTKWETKSSDPRKK